MAGRRIKVAFFDLDNTLFPASKFTKFAREKAIRAMIRAGLPHSQKQASGLLAKIVKKHGPNYEHHLDLLADSAKPAERARIVAAGVSAYHHAKVRLKPYPGIKQVLRKLRSSGITPCVISRGVPVKQWDKLLRLGLSGEFSRVFITKEKNVRTYSKIARKMRIRPEEAVMVGDHPGFDISPARKAGMHTIRLLQGKHAKDRVPPQKDADLKVRAYRRLLAAIEKL